MPTRKSPIAFILACSLSCLAFTANAEEVNETVNIHAQHHQELLEAQSNLGEEINLIDSVALQHLEEVKEMLFPAADIYGNIWNKERVNPYNIKGMELPDSANIDVSDYCIPAPGYITSNYGWRRRRMHRGVDLKVQIGDTIRAAFDGKVRLTKYERRGYGYYVIIRHDNGLETIYGHLSKFLVKPDQLVKAGEPIALGGNTGRSTGAHLHFETRYLGMDINPNAIFDFHAQKIRKDIFAFSPNLLAKNGPSSIHVDGTKYGPNRGRTYAQSKGGSTYRVRKGDTLSHISMRSGVSINRICRLNGIKRTSTLRPGQVLRLR